MYKTDEPGWPSPTLSHNNDDVPRSFGTSEMSSNKTPSVLPAVIISLPPFFCNTQSPPFPLPLPLSLKKKKKRVRKDKHSLKQY